MQSRDRSIQYLALWRADLRGFQELRACAAPIGYFHLTQLSHDRTPRPPRVRSKRPTRTRVAPSDSIMAFFHQVIVKLQIRTATQRGSNTQTAYRTLSLCQSYVGS